MPPDQVLGRFPVNSKEELDELEKDAAEQEEDIVGLFKISSNLSIYLYWAHLLQIIAVKRIIFPGGIIKNFHRLFGMEIVTNFNYDGVKDKQPLKSYNNIMDLLFSKLIF